jgi:preprotein translocase subunit SecG
MQTVLVVIELLVAVALIIFVLLQRSEGGALGMGGGSNMGGLFSPRGAADTLTRTTAVLAVLFFGICLGLNILALHGRNETSILDTPASSNAPIPKPGTMAPAIIGSPTAPAVPKPQ